MDTVIVVVMIAQIQQLKYAIEEWYEEFLWKNGPERRELAHNRLAAHEKAMRRDVIVPTHIQKNTMHFIEGATPSFFINKNNKNRLI